MPDSIPDSIRTQTADSQVPRIYVAFRTVLLLSDGAIYSYVQRCLKYSIQREFLDPRGSQIATNAVL